MYRSSFQTHHLRRVALACLFAISALLLLTDSNPWTTAQASGRVDVKQDETASGAFSSNDRSSVFSMMRMMNEVNQQELGKLARSAQAGATKTNAWLGVSGSMAGSRPAPVAPSTTLTVNKKLLSSSNITIGAPVIYEVEVKSSHPTTYNHLSVKDTLPPGFVFVSATYALSGATGPSPLAPSLNSVTSELTFGEFTLSLNGVITITINGYFTTGGPKSNSVTANDSADPVPAGTTTNSATDNETVSFNSFPVDLKVEKCVSSNSTCGSTSAVSLPGLLHYQITVTNKTAQPVYLGGLLTIRDFFTNNSSIPVKWTASGFACTPFNGAACPDLPAPTALATLPSFNTATIVFKYDMPGPPQPNDSGLLPGNASYKIDFDINLSTASTCAPATVTIQNQARLDLSNGVQSLTDQVPADNTSAPSVVTTATTNLAACPSPSPSPSPTPVTVTKVHCSTTTGPCTSGAAANWNAPVRYQVTVTNPNATQSFALTDNVYKSVGTPAFKATVISGPCVSAGCTSLTSPTLLTSPVLNSPTIIADMSPSTLWTGTLPNLSGSQVIEYLVKYVPVCETDTRADHIFNYCAAGNAVSPAVPADLPEAGVCNLSVTKTETPPGPILFGQPHAYKVVFANPSSQAMDVVVRDLLSVKSNRYGAVPFDYSVTCTATQGSITPLTGPPLPLNKNVTGASATFQSVGWRGVRLIDERMNFGAASTLTCQVTVTAHQPADTNPHCQGADNPQLTNDDPKLVNSAYIDPNNFDENGSTAPQFFSTVASDLPLCRSVIVSKTANAHSFAPGGTIVYTITVVNKGDDPVGSLTLKDIIQPPLSGVSVGTCTPANCSPPVPSLSTGLLPHQVDASYGLLQPNAPVSFPLTVTAPQAGGSYPNVAVASFLPGGNFYFQGNEQSFLQSEENIQVLTPALKKSFDPGQIGPNGAGTLTFTITNLNGDPKQTGMSFSDTLPAGLQITGFSNGCGGGVTISPDGHMVTLAGGQLVGPNADGSGQHSCQISIKVKASNACGVYKNNKDNFSQVANLDVSNIDEQLAVVGCPVTPPTLTKKFDPPKIPVNGASTLTFTITNSTGDPKQTGIAFSDTLPPGLQIAGVVSNGCSGNVTVSPDGQTVTLNNGQLVGPNADGSGQHSCQIVVRVKATGDCGVYRNTEKNFSDVKNLNVKGIDEQIVVGDCGGSGLTIEKKVPGAPPGFKGQFNFLVQCATPKGFYQKAVTVDWPTPGSITLNDVPAGSQCTVTEGPPPASLPAGFNWAGLPAYLPPGGFISIGPKGGQVVVTDTLSPCNESGQVTITKVVEGLPKDYIGVFEGTLQCWVSDKLLTYPVTLTSPNGLSTTVGNIPLGSACTFQETGQPPLKGDLMWNQPIYTPTFGTVTLTGECCQQITVINQARHCCSQSGSSGSNPRTPTNFLDHAIEQNPASYDTPVKSTPVIRAGSKPAGGKPRGN